jgi:tetratricopeptide (TPR) repeat protein
MKMSILRSTPLLPLVASILLTSGCSLSYRTATEARDLAAQGNHEAALALSLEALDANPGLRRAQIVVDDSRPRVMRTRQERANNLAAQGDTPGAIRELRNTIVLSNDLTRRQFNTPTSEAKDEIVRLSSAMGGEVIEEAHNLYAEGRFREALAKYLAAAQLASQDGLDEQIGQCYYDIAEEERSLRRYRAAIENLVQAREFAPSNSDIQRLLNGSRYQLAVCYLQSSNLRLASNEFNILASESPSFVPEGETGATARQIADEVRDLATRRISVSPFDSAPGVTTTLEGRNLPVMMQNEIFSGINTGKSDFIRLLRSDTAQDAFRQIEASRMHSASQSRVVRDISFSTADYVLGGTVVNAHLARPEPRRSNVNSSISLTTYQRQVDQNGRETYVPVGQVSHPFSYTLVEEEITLSLTVNASLTDVATNESLANPNVTTSEVDRIKYADSLQMAPPPADTRTTLEQARTRLPGDVTTLLAARRNLKSAGEMLDASQEAISSRVTSWVLQQLDQTPSKDSNPEPCAR